MITVKQEKTRISQILAADSKLSHQQDNDTRDALLFIQSHLYAFYERYSIDAQLTVTQTARAVSQWDLDQWKLAIADLHEDGWLPEAKSRQNALVAIGSLSVGHMMTAIAGLALLRLTNRRVKAAQQRLDDERQEEIKRVNKDMNEPITAKSVDDVADNLAKKARKILKKAAKYANRHPPKPDAKPDPEVERAKQLLPGPSLSERLWTDGDGLLADMQSIMNRAFTHGLDAQGLDELMQKHLKDRLNAQTYVTDRLVRSESAKVLHDIHLASYATNGIKWVNIVCEPSACTKCQQLAAAGPYRIEECPYITVDTHPNCRCSIVPAADGEDTDVRNSFDETHWQYEHSKAKVNEVGLNYVTPKQFEKAITDAKNANEHGGAVDIVAAKDVGKGWQQFARKDGMAGVTIKSDGDIIGVFKNPKLKLHGAVTDMIVTAREAGGTKMDCYGKFLVNSYEKAGFKPVARIPFNAEYVDDPDLLARHPDVFVMMKTEDTTAQVVEKIANKSYAKSSQDDLVKLPTIEDYDKAMAYRDAKLDAQEKGGK